MKNILAENLLRFGVKNLSDESKIKLSEQGAPVPTGTGPGQVNPAQAGGSTPKQILLNYDNGMLRLNAMFKGGTEMYWDTNVTLFGQPGKLTFNKVDFVPADIDALKKLGIADPKTISVATVAPVVINTPINHAVGPNVKKIIPVQLKMDANLKIVTDTINAADPNMMLTRINTELPPSIFNALSNVCAQNGWYTGPKQQVAKQYALFTNHPGTTSI